MAAPSRPELVRNVQLSKVMLTESVDRMAPPALPLEFPSNRQCFTLTLAPLFNMSAPPELFPKTTSFKATLQGPSRNTAELSSGNSPLEISKCEMLRFEEFFWQFEKLIAVFDLHPLILMSEIYISADLHEKKMKNQTRIWMHFMPHSFQGQNPSINFKVLQFG